MRTFSFRPSITLRGREFRGLRGWAGKPMHPPLTDVPIAAYLLTAAFDLISFLSNNQQPWGRDFYRAATFVLIAGAAVSVFTALTGLFDWFTTEKGTQARRTANAHAWTMIVMTMLVLWNIVLRWFPYKDDAMTPSVVLVLSLATAVLLFLGATIGGTLVYDYGFSVENSGDHPVWHPSEKDVFPGGPQEPEQSTG